MTNTTYNPLERNDSVTRFLTFLKKEAVELKAVVVVAVKEVVEVVSKSFVKKYISEKIETVKVSLRMKIDALFAKLSDLENKFNESVHSK